MKLHITISGDRSVGINDTEFDLDWNGVDLPTESQDREDQRRMFAHHFGEMFDGKAAVYFEDECPECFAQYRRSIKGRLIKNRCVNRTCPTNLLCA
jgi:hypothetical protein